MKKTIEILPEPKEFDKTAIYVAKQYPKSGLYKIKDNLSLMYLMFIDKSTGLVYSIPWDQLEQNFVDEEKTREDEIMKETPMFVPDPIPLTTVPAASISEELYLKTLAIVVSQERYKDL